MPILFLQTERSVDMLLHGKKPLVEVTFYLACLYQFFGTTVWGISRVLCGCLSRYCCDLQKWELGSFQLFLCLYSCFIVCFSGKSHFKAWHLNTHLLLYCYVYPNRWTLLYKCRVYVLTVLYTEFSSDYFFREARFSKTLISIGD